jgi:Ca-activated chloride channel family protein
MLIDTSGSMEGDKIDQARQAATQFMEKMSAKNRIGLMTFSDAPQMQDELGLAEDVKAQIDQHIAAMNVNGSTALYDALIASIDKLQALETPEGEDRIRAIVLLSDGDDTASTASLNDVLAKISAARTGRNPILVIPVAYGSDADISALNSIAQASATKVQSGDPKDIQKLLEIISSYF